MTDLQTLSAADLKALTLRAIKAGDRATVAKITAETKRRVEAHRAAGTGTAALYNAAAKLR